MARYLILNTIFIAIVLTLIKWRPSNFKSNWWLTLLILMLLTAVFDSLIIAAGIVDYNNNNILGIYIGRAPIEDFFYTILAVMVIPYLWDNKNTYEK